MKKEEYKENRYILLIVAVTYKTFFFQLKAKSV